MQRQKSYNNTPTLYILPTPIGNLDDITYRTIKVLEEVEVIFCEDTRITRQLLNHLNISNKKLISNHKYNEFAIKEKILEYLNQGNNIALVSDRGTPGISDPGFVAVDCAIENNYNVVCLPGANALIPALIMSGLDTQPFLFYGFLNSKNSKQKEELENLKNQESTIIFYEAPHRLKSTLENIYKVFGDRKIALVREISKLHEEVIRGNISEIVEIADTLKGEFVIIVEKHIKTETDYSNISILEHINKYIEEGLSSNDAIKKVAKDRNVAKNDVYKEYHKG